MSNIRTATFTECSKTARTEPLWQYDYGQMLVFSGVDLPTAYEVHFSNKPQGESKTQIGDENGVIIPDEFLLTGEMVYAWVYLHTGTDDGETVYSVEIPVRKRAARTEEEPTPVQQDAITQAIAALDAAVERTGQDSTQAQESAAEAELSAIESESWAVGGTGTRQGEDTDNAMFYAELAQQGAEASGYVWFDVNNQDGEMYITITDRLSEDVSFAVDEETGNLEVTYDE